MQTILGSGGSIGIPLAKELTAYTDRIRMVSRNPKMINEKDELFPADITDPAQLDKAIEGSEVVYLTVGFEYNIRAWREKWPALIRNVIESCRKHKARLVFFDNIYMYDRDHLNDITEDTPVRPTSRKGEVRAEIAGMIMDAAKQGKIKALIARCADYYGPKNSVLVEMVVKNLKAGKSAMWLANADKIHTFTAAIDAARATAMLGNTDDAYNQVWHMPTSKTPLRGKQWIELIAGMLNKPYRFIVIPKWVFAMSGLFVPFMRELSEMSYQFDRDYIFNSTKFERHFGYTPLEPGEGIAMLLKSL